MILLSDIRIQYGGRAVLNGITLTIGPRERVGLVGRNGAGKSTMMKILAGHLRGFEGTMSIPAGATTGFLHQDMDIPKGKTVLDEALTAFEEVLKLEARMAVVQKELETREDYESEAYIDLIHELTEGDERLRHLGGATMMADASRILAGLGFKQKDLTRQTEEFSGGWKMRIELAKMLLRRPDYLLLDEPTNHLDIESIIWLEEFLQTYEGAVVVISHDRTFLDNVTKRTVEIELGKAFDYKASYSKYLDMRAERREQLQNTFDNQQQKIAQTERLIERFRAKASKAKFAQSLIKQLDRMDKVEMDDEDTSAMRIKFPPAPRSGDIVVEMKNLTKKYGSSLIIDKIDFQLDRGERVAFVGKNGEGKTTLSKIIAGVESHEGYCQIGHNVHLGYYAQNQAEILNPNMTVYDTIDKDAPFEMRPRLRNILGSFLFSNDDVDKKVSVLSGGERARLAMACLLLRPINLLILDEPTNHLDMISKEVLKEALENYDGTMIVVSHDRDFLVGLTDRTVEFRDKKVYNHLGDVKYFLEKRKLDNMRDVSLGVGLEKAASAGKSSNGTTLDAEGQKEQKRLQKLVQTSEKRVEDLERKLKNLENQMAEPGVFGSPKYDKILSEYNSFKAELDTEMENWENAQLALETL